MKFVFFVLVSGTTFRRIVSHNLISFSCEGFWNLERKVVRFQRCGSSCLRFGVRKRSLLPREP